ncbi:MAG: MFS transporter permease [Ketobacter sp.]|nr:MFS transporter permease [Ketobacter sp.]
MEEWSTYAVANFIPFTAEVYLRLIERVNAAWWPLHLATTVIGIGALALAVTGRRLAGTLLALLWGWAAYGFLQQFYANLNWAGVWFARGFYLQALLLTLLIFTTHQGSKLPTARLRSGVLLATLGLFWPLISLIGRVTLRQTEVVGIHADPTTIFALGVILLMQRGWWLWVLLPMPLLWCLISGLSLWVLGQFQAGLLLAAPMIAILGLCWRTPKE